MKYLTLYIVSFNLKKPVNFKYINSDSMSLSLAAIQVTYNPTV